jgi:hypothetical protein
MIEIFIVLATIFLIVVVFYMHRHPEITILQVEQDQVESQFPVLLEERQPIVIRGCQAPKGLTHEALQKSARLAQFIVGQQTLATVLANPLDRSGRPILTQDEREELAEQLSMPVWANHIWLPLFKEYSWIAPIVGTMQTEVLLGGTGMVRTKALYTCILPTEGKYMVSLLSKSSEAFLPASWEYRYPSSLTSDDTPLVADLKYMDIVLNPGNGLCIPAHMIISIEPVGDTFHSAAILEYHEPISVLAKSLNNKGKIE